MDEGKMRIKIEINGESISTEVDKGATVQALFEEGHLRGVEVDAVRVNARSAVADEELEDGDVVQNAPTGGLLA